MTFLAPGLPVPLVVALLWAVQSFPECVRAVACSDVYSISGFIPDLGPGTPPKLDDLDQSPKAQAFRPGSVPLVPAILKAGVTIPDPCPHTASMEPERYMIAWNEPGIDGDFMLVVHPRQLFLRSGHNNPNPNYVYWVAQLSEGQYTSVVKFLGGYKERVFRRNRWDRWPGYTLFTLENPRISPHLPDRMTPDSEAAWRQKFDAAVNANLRRILRELNRGLSQAGTVRLDAAINRYPNIVRIAE